MSDRISRQDALRELNGACSNWKDDAKVAEIIKSLPSAEPPYQYSTAYVEQIRGERDILQDMVNNMAEPKTGRWVPVTNGRGGHECDQCHNYAPSWATGEERLTNFCPDCGCRMEGGDTE